MAQKNTNSSNKYQYSLNKLTSLKLGMILILGVIVVFGLSISVQSLLASWTSSVSSPPISAMFPPVYENATVQSKLGSLTILGNFYVSTTTPAKSTLFVESSSGRVGIGTNALSSALTINHESGPTISLGGGVANYRGIKIADINNLEKWFVGASSSDFVIRRAGLENNLTIDSLGRIGVGVSPSSVAKLTVSGNIDLISGVFKINNATTTGNPWVSVGSSIYYPGKIAIGTTTVSTTSSLLVQAKLNSIALQIYSNTSDSLLNIVNQSGESVFRISATGVLATGSIPISKLTGDGPTLDEVDPKMGAMFNDSGAFDGNILKWDGASTTNSQIWVWDYWNQRIGIGMKPTNNDALAINGNVLALGDVYSRGTAWTHEAPDDYEEASARYLAVGKGVLVAAGGEGIYISSDGYKLNYVPLTSNGNPLNIDANAVTFGNNIFIAVGDNGVIATSSNGIDWNMKTLSAPFDKIWNSVTYCTGKYIAVASNTIMASANTASWNLGNFPSEISWATGTPIDKVWSSVTCGKDGGGTEMAVAVAFYDPGTYHGADDANWGGETTLPTTYAIKSYDGINWQTSNLDSYDPWIAVTYGNGKFVVISYDDYTKTRSSTDGSVWTPVIQSPDYLRGQSIVYADSKFVVVGYDGRSAYSADGTNWNIVDGEYGNWTSVVYKDDKFISIAPYDGLKYSVHGTDWSDMYSGNVSDVQESIAYGNNTFVVVHSVDTVSGYGKIMTSIDGGENWVSKDIADTDASANGWRSVAYGGASTFVAIAGNGDNDRKAIYSTDSGDSWTYSNIGLATDNWQSVAHGTINNFAAVATGKVACTGDYGQNWNTYAVESKMWQSVAYGAGKYVAVSGSGVDKRVMTAVNCSGPWTLQNTPVDANNNWTSITYGGTPGNEKFVAVANTGTKRVMYSADGITWTTVNGQIGLWSSVIYGEGVFVAVDNNPLVDDVNRVMTSSDGINWSLKIAQNNTWQSVAYGNYGGVGTFVATALSERNSNIMKSTNKGDDNTWTIKYSASDSHWRSVAYGNGIFVAVADSGERRIFTSQTGDNWTTAAAPNNRAWSSVTYGNGIFVAVSATSTTGGGVMTSPDGVNWKYYNTAIPNKNWTAITYGNDKFVAVADDGSGGNKSMYSYDGINWVSGTTPNNANEWSSVAYGNNRFVAVADDGIDGTENTWSMTSQDGISWVGGTVTPTVTPSPNGPYRWSSITYGNGVFVAVSTNQYTSMTSVDGVNWNYIYDNAPNLRAVAYGGGLFIGVSDTEYENRVNISRDGLNWVSRGSANGYNLRAVAYGNGVFVAVSTNGSPGRVYYSYSPEANIISPNNTYQGGMNIFGYLGLGTSTPKGNLHTYQTTGNNAEIRIQSVAGIDKHWAIYNERSTNDLIFWNNTPTSVGAKNILTLKDEGNVGIGTTNPGTKLNLYDDLSGPIITLSGLNSNYRGMKITDLNNAEKWFFGTNNNNNFIISRNGGFADLFISSSTGYIGIGMSLPTQKLEVAGNMKSTQIHANKYCAADGTGCIKKELECITNNSIDIGDNKIEKLACPIGYKVTGGGCDWALSGALNEKISSYPISVDNSWYCEGNSSNALNQIYVRCCR